MLEWLEMGGFWPYVWPAYGIALLGLGAILVSAFLAHRGAMAARKDEERMNRK